MLWVKLFSEWLKDEKLAECSEGARLLFLACLSLAGECEADGALMTGAKPMTVRGLAFRANMSDETLLASRLGELVAVGLITNTPPAPISVTNFAKRQVSKATMDATREAARERVTRRRSRPVPSNTDYVPSNIQSDKTRIECVGVVVGNSEEIDPRRHELIVYLRTVWGIVDHRMLQELSDGCGSAGLTLMVVRSIIGDSVATGTGMHNPAGVFIGRLRDMIARYAPEVA